MMIAVQSHGLVMAIAMELQSSMVLIYVATIMMVVTVQMLNVLQVLQ
jgi:hypothetical protein